MLEIIKSEFEKKIKSFTLQTDGDIEERTYFKDIDFPQYEKFWKLFVIPATKRIEVSKSSEDYIRMRNNVNSNIEKIARIHYSIFVRLVQAKYIIIDQRKYFIDFEGCFIKLGQICDLIDEFLIEFYLLISKIKNKKPKILAGLIEDEFLMICKEFYKTDYPKLYENYISKGKILPLRVPQPHNLVKEFFQKNNKEELFKKWDTFYSSIRQYRNYFVHDTISIRAFSEDGVKIPKRQKINQISNFKDLLSIKEEDYVLAINEMTDDYNRLKDIMKEIWEFIIEQFEVLRYNPDFLKLYSLKLID